MSIDPILALTLLAAIAALFAIRLTFRNAATARDALFTPTVFAICGGLIGIAVGMIWLADREGRVTIDKGAMLLTGGICLGSLAGAGARNVYSRLNRGKAAAFVLMMMLLGGSIGAPIGWLAGAGGAGGASNYELKSDYEHALKELSRQRMLWGILFGSGIGLFLGFTELLFRRRGAT